MKYLVVMVITLAAFVAADEEWNPVRQKAAFTNIFDDCTKESGITPEQLEKVNKMEYPDEKEAREYMRCVAKKFGVFTDDKGYNVERLMAQIGAAVDVEMETIRETITGCIDNNEQKSPPDVWAYRGQKCIMEDKIFDELRASKKKE